MIPPAAAARCREVVSLWEDAINAASDYENGHMSAARAVEIQRVAEAATAKLCRPAVSVERLRALPQATFTDELSSTQWISPEDVERLCAEAEAAQ